MSDTLRDRLAGALHDKHWEPQITEGLHLPSSGCEDGHCHEAYTLDADYLLANRPGRRR